MINTISISDDLSSEVAQAILTKQKEWGGDPRALLNLVLTVHDTLRDLSLKSTSDSTSNVNVGDLDPPQSPLRNL